MVVFMLGGKAARGGADAPCPIGRTGCANIPTQLTIKYPYSGVEGNENGCLSYRFWRPGH